MLGMQYISNYVVMVLAAINPGWLQTYQDLMESIGFGDVTLLLALYSVLIAPISEELIFRGVTLKLGTKAMPFFAEKIFGSIYLSILFHMLFNIWGTFAPSFLSYDGKSILIHIVIFVLAVCFALAGVFLYQKGLKRRTPMPEAFQNH